MTSRRADPIVKQTWRMDWPSAARIQVNVGGNESIAKETFFIDRLVLQQKGTHFLTLPRDQKIEGERESISLPEISGWLFGIYAEWLYSGQINWEFEIRQDYIDAHLLLCMLYTVGERGVDRRFQDRLTDDAHGRTWEDESGPADLVCAEAVNLICEHTPSTSPMRRLLLKITAARCTSTPNEELLTFLREVNNAFMIDVVAELARQRDLTHEQRQGERMSDPYPDCEYHHHTNDEPCPTMTTTHPYNLPEHPYNLP